MSIQTPILLPSYQGLLTNPKREVHPLSKNQSLRLVAWKVSGKSQMEFQERFPIPSPKQEEWEQFQLQIGMEKVGVVKDKLIPLDVM